MKRSNKFYRGLASPRPLGKSTPSPINQKGGILKLKNETSLRERCIGKRDKQEPFLWQKSYMRHWVKYL